MLQRLRETLVLLLLALLPFHALFITVATRVILGPGHAPMGVLAVWKEVLLAIVLLVTVCELMRGEVRLKKIDMVDWCIVGLSVIALGLFFAFHLPMSLGSFALGFKYDLLPLGAFLILRRASWSEGLFGKVEKVIFGAAAIVVLWTLLSRIVPPIFFYALGYSDLSSLYLPDKPLAAFQFIQNTQIPRLQGPMSGPNQLGLWMLIPIGFLLARLVSRKPTPQDMTRASFYALTLLFTFSRAAWIAAFVICVIALMLRMKKEMRRRFAVSAGAGLVVIAGILSVAFPSTIFRVASSSGHLALPLAAVERMVQHPLGLGLGTIGPASNRSSDACAMLEAGSDASWAKDRPNLCVFVGATQVQPLDRVCHCPVLTENWYLQIGDELGVAGFVIFIILTVVIFRRLAPRTSPALSLSNGHLAPFLIFLALSIGALFLHAWEDSAIAYSVWILTAITLTVATARAKG